MEQTDKVHYENLLIKCFCAQRWHKILVHFALSFFLYAQSVSIYSHPATEILLFCEVGAMRSELISKDSLETRLDGANLGLFVFVSRGHIFLSSSTKCGEYHSIGFLVIDLDISCFYSSLVVFIESGEKRKTI